MPGFIPNITIDEIQSRCDIVDVISDYIPLVRTGRNFKALCPFHAEKTPSFIVSSDKQIYHCFGCGAGGDVFGFVMKYERLEFTEAVKELAHRVGIEIPQLLEPSTQSSSNISQIYRANELATEYYHDMLKQSTAGAAYKYLKNRGIEDWIIDKFRLGYAPGGWEKLVSYAKTKKVGLGLLEKAGLILAGKESGYYDRFRNRAIFPIFNTKNKPVGFGARVLDNSLPKYINSPETEAYTKGKHLYGLNFSIDEVKNKDSLVIVEGYFDMITPYQHGVQNIVASLGTALTVEQIRLIKRYTQNVIMVYDADQAGESATLRGLDLLVEEGLSVRIVNLPQDSDPDSCVRKEGIEKFKDRISKAKDLFDYKLSLLISKFDQTKSEGKVRIAEEMLPTIAKVRNAILRTEYVKRLAEGLSVDEEAVLAELKKIKVNNFDAAPVRKNSQFEFEIHPAEKILVKLMLEDIGVISEVKANLRPEDFRTQETRDIVNALFILTAEGKLVNPSRLISYIRDEKIGQIISKLASSVEVPGDKHKNMCDCINRIKEDNLKLKLNRLRSEMGVVQNSGSDEELKKLVIEYNNLIKERVRSK